MDFQATPLNVTTPTTQDSFLGNGVGNSVTFFGMSVDPASGDLVVGGPLNMFSRIKRGTGTIIQQYQIGDDNVIGLAFGEAKTIATQIGLSIPATIIQGNQSQFASVTVTAGDGSTPTGKVQLVVVPFGAPEFTQEFTQDLVNGSAKFAIDSLPVGQYRVQAIFPQVGMYGAISSDVQQITITPTPIATQITLLAPTSMVQGDRTVFAGVRVTAADGSTPTGTVQLTFSGFGTFTHTLAADGTTNYTLFSLPAGTYTLQASYAAQGVLAASQSTAQTLQVTPH